MFLSGQSGNTVVESSSPGVSNVFFPVCQFVKFNVKIYVCVPMKKRKGLHLNPVSSQNQGVFRKKKKSSSLKKKKKKSSPKFGHYFLQLIIVTS